MDPSELPYADIVEVRNCGRRRANILLAHDWVLLDWRTEQTIQRRDVPDAAGQQSPTMYFKIESIQYILGRPTDNDYTGVDLEEEERRQRREEDEARRQADESRVATKLPAGVEEAVRETVAVGGPGRPPGDGDTPAERPSRPRPDTPLRP